MVDKITSIENITNKAETPEVPPLRRTAWDWAPASPYRCPRCSTIHLTKELAARCLACGFREDGT